MCPMSKVRPFPSHAAKAPAPALASTSPQQSWETVRVLLLCWSPAAKAWESEGHRPEWLGFSSILLWPHALSYSLICHISNKKKMAPWRWRAREMGSIAYLSAACGFRMLWAGRHTPWNTNGEEGTCQCPFPSPRKEAPSPRSSHLDISLAGHLSSVLTTLESPGQRVPSLYGLCNKVLIHVNLCGNYCVQQYFLVYLFFLCGVSLFFLFINVYFCLKGQTSVS